MDTRAPAGLLPSVVWRHPAEHLRHEFTVYLKNKAQAPYFQKTLVFELLPAACFDWPIVYLVRESKVTPLARLRNDLATEAGFVYQA